MADIEIRTLESDDGGHLRGEGTLLGLARSREEAEKLARVFPGEGRCYLWDPADARCLLIMSWLNRREAN